MPRFHYTAIRENGESYEGETEAADRFAVYKIVRENGGMVQEVRPADQTRGLKEWYQRINSFLSRVKDDDLVMLTRNLAAMIDAGLAAARALSVMQRQTKNPRLKRILEAVETDIRQGGTLHEALAKHPKAFSKLMVAMVKAGEESGKLADSLRTISKQLEAASTLKKKIRGAMIYPGIIITAMVAVAVLMLVFIVPTLESTFKEFGTDLPASTQAIIGVSNFLTQHTILAILTSLAVVVAVVLYARTRFGKQSFEFALLHLPIISTIVKESNAARTSRTLSSLLASGVGVTTALSITEEVIQNSYYKAVLAEAGERVEKGAPISEVFTAHEDIYPVLVGEMIAVGEETGKLADMLAQIADFYEAEVTQKTKDLSTIVEPILMIAVGIGVGFFAISMISPIYSLSGSI